MQAAPCSMLTINNLIEGSLAVPTPLQASEDTCLMRGFQCEIRDMLTPLSHEAALALLLEHGLVEALETKRARLSAQAQQVNIMFMMHGLLKPLLYCCLTT